MNLSKVSYLLLLVAGALAFSCSSATDEDEEFIATLADFSGYSSWTKVATEFGPDALLMTAHGTDDSLYRHIYFKDNQKASNGKYPVGTIIVKELKDEMGALTGALTMMVKRGGDFNSDGDGWEWFMTSTDLTTVLTQGDNATAGDGMCASCHTSANVNSNGTDWVFSQAAL